MSLSVRVRSCFAIMILVTSVVPGQVVGASSSVSTCRNSTGRRRAVIQDSSEEQM